MFSTTLWDYTGYVVVGNTVGFEVLSACYAIISNIMLLLYVHLDFGYVAVGTTLWGLTSLCADGFGGP